MQAIFLAVHVFANTVWIGSIATVGWLLVEAERANDPSIAKLARNLYQRAATPAFGVSFVAGVGRLLSDPAAYMRLHWFHGKLTAALAVIALHHILGARARRAAAAGAGPGGPSGSRQAGRSSAILTGATLACAFVTVTLAVLKGQVVP
jgi:protoporphyrinogen IX oxidase